MSRFSGGFKRLFGTATVQNLSQKASTNTLKSALTKYVQAVNKLEKVNGPSIRSLLNAKANNSNKTYKNTIANSIAGVVSQSRGAIASAAIAGPASVAPVNERQAAAVVNNVTRQLNNLNKYMNTLSGYTNNKDKMNQYQATGRKLNSNMALNAGRKNGQPKYQNFFKKLKNARYNLNNRNKNVPRIRNISTGNIFNQENPAPNVINRNLKKN